MFTKLIETVKNPEWQQNAATVAVNVATTIVIAIVIRVAVNAVQSGIEHAFAAKDENLITE